MVNPGAFRGLRKDFLLGQKADYATAIGDGTASEVIFSILRKYFKRFPVDLPHNEEPSPEFLASVDDEEPDPEVVEPNPLAMTDDEFKEADAKFKARQELIKFRREQIKCWFSYQYMKDNDMDPSDNAHSNPYRDLICKLTGKQAVRPCVRTGANIWRKSHKEEIENRLKSYAAGRGLQKSQYAAQCDRIAREMFDALSDEVQYEWREIAKKEHEQGLAEWKANIAAGASTKPEDRQRAIQGLVRFTQPILDLIADHTGWKVTLLAGGPEPAQGGLLNVISVHAGTTSGDVKMNFGIAERQRFKTTILPIFGSFLKKCYTVKECQSRALDRSEGYLALNELEVETDSVLFDTVRHDFSALVPFDSTPEPDSASSNSDHGAASSSPPLPSNPATNDSSLCPAPVTATPGTTSVPNAVGLPARPFKPPPSSSHTLASAAPVSAAHVDPHAASCDRFGGVNDAAASVSSLTSNTCPPTAPDVGHITAPTCTTSQEMVRDVHDTAGAESFTAARSLSPLPSPLRSPPLSPPPDRMTSPSPHPLSSLSDSGARPDAAPNLRSSPIRTRTAKKRSREVDGTAPDLPPKRRCNASVSINTSNPTQKSSRQKAHANARTSTYGRELPTYFVNGRNLFHSVDLGTQWSNLVDLWIKYEKARNFGQGTKGRIQCKFRPPVLADWIKSGRLVNFLPKILDASQFGRGFEKWWAASQPSWRLDLKGEIVLDKLDGDWSSLNIAGPNGFTIVTAGLFFWGRASKEEGKDTDDWQHTSKDVSQVLSILYKLST